MIFIPAILMLISCGSSEDPDFVTAEMEWREARHQNMQKSDSWLTIAGLFWLEEGENTFGTAPTNAIRLPEESAPAFSGSFILKDNDVTVRSAGGEHLKHNGETVEEMILRSDRSERPDRIELNDLRMWVIERGDRMAIRLRDLQAERFKDYKGLRFFPPRQQYRVQADFIPFDESKTVVVNTVVGTESKMQSPGYVAFNLSGQDLRLDAFGSGSDVKGLFFVFTDLTSGKETYGASRFMQADILENGKVDLNFNRAYNPPCAYTPFATCPLPPPQNHLSVRIEAGEKVYEGSH